MVNYGQAILAVFGSYLIEIRSLLDNKLLLGSQLFSLTRLQLVTYVVYRAHTCLYRSFPANLKKEFFVFLPKINVHPSS